MNWTSTNSWDPPSPAAGRRRAMVAQGAPTSSWDVPGAGGPAPTDTGWGASHAAGSFGSTGDPVLDAARAAYLGDASGRVRGARLSAQNAAPNDPSAAAYASLAALLGGQSDAAHGLQLLGAQRVATQDAQGWQEHMARLEEKLREMSIRAANKNAWIGELASLGGTLGGAYLSGRRREDE